MCRRYCLTEDILSLWRLSSFCPFFFNAPWALGTGCTVDTSVGSGHPTVNCSLHFKQLWISVMVSICCRRSFFDRFFNTSHGWRKCSWGTPFLQSVWQLVAVGGMNTFLPFLKNIYFIFIIYVCVHVGGYMWLQVPLEARSIMSAGLTDGRERAYYRC